MLQGPLPRAWVRERSRHIVSLGCPRPAPTRQWEGEALQKLPGPPAFTPCTQTTPLAEDRPRGNGIKAREALRPQVWEGAAWVGPGEARRRLSLFNL